MKNQFNLVDEPWIPIADIGLVGLKQAFSDPTFRELGGNPIQKISVFKFLMAIAQTACTPDDENGWHELSAQGMANACIAYLEQWHDRFFLYGEKPFLQIPMIASAREQSFGVVMPQISTGNTTVLNQIQVRRPLDDADKALLLLGLMGFALGGKKTDNSVVLTPGYLGKSNEKGKPSTAKPGPSVGFKGLLHSFLQTDTLLSTLWLNLFTMEELNNFPKGCGTPPWENMPVGEDCAVARDLKQSLMGRLIPMCRFCLLTEHGMHYSEGLSHPGYQDGVSDPTTAIDNSGKDPRALWVNPDKRPWRELTALLSYFSEQQTHGFQCAQIRTAIKRIGSLSGSLAIWSGGLCVSSNAGEQYASGNDDYVESVVWLQKEFLGRTWFLQLQHEMTALDEIAKMLYGRVNAYYKEQLVDGVKTAQLATRLFWQLCERDFQNLVNNCSTAFSDELHGQRLRFAGYLRKAYDDHCPNETARQLDAWAKCRPNLGKYLLKEG